MPTKRILVASGIFFAAFAGAVLFAVLALVAFANALDAASIPRIDPASLFPFDSQGHPRLQPDFSLYSSEIKGLSVALTILGANSIWLYILRGGVGCDTLALFLLAVALFPTAYIVNSNAQPSTDELFNQWAHDRYGLEITSVPHSFMGGEIRSDPIRLEDGQIVRIKTITDSHGESGYLVMKAEDDEELPVTAEK